MATDGESAHALAARADAALYRAKRQGRNRVRFSEDPEATTATARPSPPTPPQESARAG